MAINNIVSKLLVGIRQAQPYQDRGIIIVGGKADKSLVQKFAPVSLRNGYLSQHKKPASAEPGQDRGIIIVGGNVGPAQKAMERGIIIVGGKSLIRG